AAEGGNAVDGGGRGRVAAVGERAAVERQCDGGRVGGDGVAAGVLDRHGHRRGAGAPARGVGRPLRGGAAPGGLDHDGGGRGGRWVRGAATARLPKVATPPETAAVAVLPPPTKVPPLSVSVTVELLSAVKVLPYWSSTATWTAGLRATPVSPLGGC